MMSQLERGVDAADAGNATIRASRGRRTAERQRRRGNQRSKEELRSSTAQRFRSTQVWFTAFYFRLDAGLAEPFLCSLAFTTHDLLPVYEIEVEPVRSTHITDNPMFDPDLDMY